MSNVLIKVENTGRERRGVRDAEENKIDLWDFCKWRGKERDSERERLRRLENSLFGARLSCTNSVYLRMHRYLHRNLCKNPEISWAAPPTQPGITRFGYTEL